MDFTAPDKFINLSNLKGSKINFDAESAALLIALDSASKEADIQHYIKDNRKWFIPASIMVDYDFGPHEEYIVPEQPLGAEYCADYMLLGSNSIGFHIVLVEFEDVNVDYKLLNSNAETEAVRKGLTQIRDWKRWMADNRVYFLESCGLGQISRSIPQWGIHYCLVVSRRSRMNDIANQMRGQTQHETPELHIVTYDRLVDNVRKLTNGF